MLLLWWQRLLGVSSRWSAGKSRRDESQEETTTTGYCKHNRTQRKTFQLLQRMGGQSRKSVLRNLCPLCGLRPPGHPRVEYNLVIWFIDGDSHEYRFRNRRESDCYEVNGSVLKIYLRESIIYYPLGVIGTIQFGACEIAPDSPVVAEARRIIASISEEPH